MTYKEKAQFILDVLSVYNYEIYTKEEWSEHYIKKINDTVDNMRVNWKLLSVCPMSDDELQNIVKLMFLEEFLQD